MIRCRHCQAKIKFLYGFWVMDIPLDEKVKMVRNLGGKEIYDNASGYCKYDYLTATSRRHLPLEDSIVDQILTKYSNDGAGRSDLGR